MRNAADALYMTLPATASNVTVLRRRLRAFISAGTDDADVVDDLTLAVGEALANTADHAYRDTQPTRPMRLAACMVSPCGSRAIVVTISDDGAWRPARDPGHRGRGLSMIGQLVASLSVAAGGDGTCLTICHPLPRAAGPQMVVASA